ncbi:MAG: hypothetical protein COX79_02645 [Candidatus Levybacteria bacterium CG_4_10_14_0_2_um_filter_36_16]|nr:MAG: hypothetical protein AUK12_04960 [Candidatus Levybacteria bacterium CG2_30_37_29]PIZ97294.1 MAG: hypothetical protein COX79_02645 [Candidatus Levybacteria bacterium CG_4_10_14_0_2_um_filter_36_16]PJA90895.1 MAG: hypothetical protein CO136_00200 [Candidatus Levybacteria bacterium CG_4_9_14_3_um_filter_36_7]
MPSKKSDLQIYADECFPFTTVLYLRSLGYSIRHALEYNFLNKPDISHLKHAKKLGKTLITLDRDFLGYTTARAEGTKGIVVITVGSNAPKHINSICKKQLPKIKRSVIANSVILISNDKITKTRK